MGRLSDSWTVLPSSSTQQWHTNLQYDLAGDLKQLMYPDGRVITQTYSASGWLSGSILASYNGTSINKDYIAATAYYPTGSLQYITMGDSSANNTFEAWKYDDRMRLCEIAASIGNPVNTAPGSPGAFGNCGTPVGANIGENKVLDKLYTFTPNANIQTVTDSMNGVWSESAKYDYRDTLLSWSNSNGSSESYTVDAWGCLQESGTYNFAYSCTSNNQLSSSGGYTYDAAGNMTQDGPISLGGHLYTYDAEGGLATIGVAVNTPTAFYTYDGDGDRIRKDYNGTYTEYIWLGGKVLAQHNADGTWSDNIYANGRKIARSDSYDRRIVLGGTYASTGVTSGVNFSNLNGYTIQSGDHLFWRQYNAGANGGLNLQSGSEQAAGDVYDTAGVVINGLTTQNQWVEREVDLTSFAGLVISNGQFLTATSTPAGTWSIYFGDVALVHPDGTVIAIYNRGTSFSFGSAFSNGSGITNQSAAVVTSTAAADAANPTVTTTYYVSDQIGSSRMDIAYGSWPTWWGAFNPYGTEIDTNATTNNFKFSGMERDAQTGEAGLDNFGARSYSSTLVGKFMQPDPAGLASANLWNPQSFYLYGYVMNNPLNLIDPTGMDCLYFNNEGDDIESVDPDNSSGECANSGGDWVNGTLQAAAYNSSNGTFGFISSDSSNTYISTGSAPGPQSDGTGCSEGCISAYAQYSNWSPTVFQQIPGYMQGQSAPSSPKNASNRTEKTCSALDPNCKPPSYVNFLGCMAVAMPTMITAGETGGNQTKALGLGTLAGLAYKFRSAPVGPVAAALVGVSIMSAGEEANETCTKSIYGEVR
jgi:RHS repeat-associated protein